VEKEGSTTEDDEEESEEEDESSDEDPMEVDNHSDSSVSVFKSVRRPPTSDEDSSDED